MPNYRCYICGEPATHMYSLAGQGQTFCCTDHAPDSVTAEQRAEVRLTDDEREASEQRAFDAIEAAIPGYADDTRAIVRALTRAGLLADRVAAEDHGLRAVIAVHEQYFDMDGEPGFDDTTPEPEDVWRYDRDFRAALALDGDEAARGGAGVGG